MDASSVLGVGVVVAAVALFLTITTLRRYSQRLDQNALHESVERALRSSKPGDSVLVRTVGGLCNRLRLVFSVLAKARKLGVSLRVIWVPDSECNGHFLDVFEPVPDIQFVGDSWVHALLPLAIESYLAVGDRDYSRLVPVEPVRTRVKALLQDLGRPFAAMHLRRTDLALLGKNDDLHDDKFETVVRDENPSHKIYLATDNADTQTKFLRNFPGRIVVNKPIEKQAGSRRQTGLDHAVVDLFTCAHSDRFVGTKNSSFSQEIEALAKFVR